MAFKLAICGPELLNKQYDLLKKYCPRGSDPLEQCACDIEDQKDRGRLVDLKTKLNKYLEPNDKKSFIKVGWDSRTILDPVNFDFRIFTIIAPWKILSDKCKHNGRKIKCSDCGNWSLNPDFQTQFNPKTLWKKTPVYSLNSANFYLTRHSFIREFERQGFTGVTFKLFTEEYSRMEIVQHEWNDRSGVCRTCGMKTNVIREAYFNLPEKYLYDFQRLQYNINAIDWAGDSGMYDQRIVMSSRSANFLHKYSKILCNPAEGIPILPGYLSDIIWPEDRMFTDGDYPDSVLRKT